MMPRPPQALACLHWAVLQGWKASLSWEHSHMGGPGRRDMHAQLHGPCCFIAGKLRHGTGRWLC